MVVVLIYHVCEHSSGLCLVALSTQATAAPRDFFPNENAQLVTQAENDIRLLVMPQTDEVDAHFFHHLYFRYHLLFCHGSAYAGMIFVAVGTF